jgi:phosphatidyl-myo-inositol dimannoside synthase
MTQMRTLAHELALKHDVEVAAAIFREQNLKRLKVLEDSLLIPAFEDYNDDGIQVHALTPSPLDRVRMLPIAANVIPKVRRYYGRGLRRFGYRFFRSVYVPKLRSLVRGQDIVHATASDYLGWATLEAARAENVPYVLSTYVHPGHYGDDEDNVAYYNRADVVFALMESDRDNLISLGVAPERIYLSGVVPLLPESSDPEGFRAIHGLGNKPVVLFIGRHEEYKGPKALLESAQRVWQQMPDVHFLFIGPAGKNAERWFQEHQDPRVRYLGLVSEQEKADALAACDLFSMPSVAEILPAVFLEAWSYAKPVLGGTAAGLPELIDGNAAGLTVAQDPELIAERIIELLQDEPRRREMGERGRELVARRFSKPALVRALESAYEEVLGLSSPDESNWRNESVHNQRGETLISQFGKR